MPAFTAACRRRATLPLQVIALLAASLSDSLAADPAPVETASEPSTVPEYVVIARQEKISFFPCGKCHKRLKPNTDIRQLRTGRRHPKNVEHGAGEVWCTSCHAQSPYEMLHTLLGEPVSYDESYRVCGGCHSHKLRDWKYGAHGKRVSNWRGERLLYGCPECHNPHRPAIAPRPPMAPPPVRAGLERVNGHLPKPTPVWESGTQEAAHE